MHLGFIGAGPSIPGEDLSRQKRNSEPRSSESPTHLSALHPIESVLRNVRDNSLFEPEAFDREVTAVLLLR